MSTDPPSGSEGVRRIIAFNSPKLLAGVSVIATGSAIAGAAGGVVRVSALLATLTTTYFLVSSLAVSWWIYDRSDLHAWRWLQALLPAEAARWALVHAGFDESGPSLSAALGSPGAVVDLSPQLRRISPSLRRARRRNPAEATACAHDGQLPIGTGALDAVLLVFAAHELRDASTRETLFDELRRVLRPKGRVVLVEHLRDVANIAAFGPGAWHFQTRREWSRLASQSGFDTVHEVNKTAFVRGFSLCPS